METMGRSFLDQVAMVKQIEHMLADVGHSELHCMSNPYWLETILSAPSSATMA